MTRMLDRLEQKICWCVSAQMRTGVRCALVLTGEGQALADQLPTIGAAAMNQLAGAITPQELQSLEHILKNIARSR